MSSSSEEKDVCIMHSVFGRNMMNMINRGRRLGSFAMKVKGGNIKL